MGGTQTRLVGSHQGEADDHGSSDHGKVPRPQSLDDLPDELLAAIAQWLDCTDNYSTMRRVSRRWRAIVSDRTLIGPPSCFRPYLDKALDDKRRKKYLYAHAPTCPRYRLACADAIRAGAGPSMLYRLKGLGHAFNKDAIMAAILADDTASLDVLWSSKKCSIESEHYNAAARYGRVNVLAHFLAKEGSNWRNAGVAAVAARYGHIDCLKLAHRSGIPWDKKVAVAAARGGHVDCLAYARDYGCPWDSPALYKEAKSYKRKACCDYIARHATERFVDESHEARFWVTLVFVVVLLLFGMAFFMGVGCAHFFDKNK
jgi:hypothetical protein